MKNISLGSFLNAFGNFDRPVDSTGSNSQQLVVNLCYTLLAKLMERSSSSFVSAVPQSLLKCRLLFWISGTSACNQCSEMSHYEPDCINWHHGAEALWMLTRGNVKHMQMGCVLFSPLFCFFYFCQQLPLPPPSYQYTIQCACKVHPFIANSDIDNLFSLALPSQLSIYFNFNVFISIAPFTIELSLGALQSAKPRAWSARSAQ